jgi:hypothetical protein
MKRSKIPRIATAINKDMFDYLFEHFTDRMSDNIRAKAQKSELKKWRKLKQQLI